MRRFSLLIGVLFLFVGAGSQAMIVTAQEQAATVELVVQPAGKKVFFQSESDSVHGYKPVEPGSVVKVSLSHPVYYYYVDSRSGFHSVYLTPGASVRIVEKDGKVDFEGDHAAVNRYMQAHPAVVTFPKDTTPYSQAWLEAYREAVNRQVSALQASGLPEEFVRIHSIYYRYSYLRQLLSGPDNLRVFMNKEPDLPAGYYEEIWTNRYEDADVLYYPKWYTVIKSDLELREKKGRIEPDCRTYITRYAEALSDAKVKEAFLLRHLAHVLESGYTDDFPSYLSQARKAVAQPASSFLEGLSRLERLYARRRQACAGMVRGSLLPAFEGVDVAGHTHRSSQYAGQVWVLDFWFSGCMPCKAEMPYMERLAEEFKGENIRFFCLSLDSGPQLLSAWKKLAEEKKGVSTHHLNLPGGFKSSLARWLGIHGVPRIVIVDQDGKIVDAFARRPSDPKLRQQLWLLLEKNKASCTEPSLSDEERMSFPDFSRRFFASLAE